MDNLVIFSVEANCIAQKDTTFDVRCGVLNRAEELPDLNSSSSRSQPPCLLAAEQNAFVHGVSGSSSDLSSARPHFAHVSILVALVWLPGNGTGNCAAPSLASRPHLNEDI